MNKIRTKAVEDYLKAVYSIERERGRVSTTALADRLLVTPASVTGMAKKLAAMDLVAYKPYRGVKLTRAGRKIALETLRRHRLVELYLVEQLGVPWDEVHAEAEKWEHVISPQIAERIDALLGRPKVDPHGAPIPTKTGKVAQADRVRLTAVAPGRRGVVAEVSDRDPVLLRYLGKLGLCPGVKIRVLAVEPFNGPISVLVGQVEQVLGSEAARHILVNVKGGARADNRW